MSISGVNEHIEAVLNAELPGVVALLRSQL